LTRAPLWGARGFDACRCVRPPARRGYVLALVAHFELTLGKGGDVRVEVDTGESATPAAADEISAQVASLFTVLTAANAATVDVPLWLPDQGRGGERARLADKEQ
jgi:hypothetical protein